jgi:hypothetical protein
LPTTEKAALSLEVTEPGCTTVTTSRSHRFRSSRFWHWRSRNSRIQNSSAVLPSPLASQVDTMLVW